MTTKIKKQVADLNKRSVSAIEVDKNMENFNRLLDGYGIEAITKEDYWHKYYFQNIRLLYVNMGDSYTQTVFFDTAKLRYFVADMATAVKRFKL